MQIFNPKLIVKKFLTMLLLMSVCAGVQAQDKKFIKGFSGGMMVHTGYQFGGDNPYNYNPEGATFGIGGVARVHLTEHFRTGFEGYMAKMGLANSLVKRSNNKVFWTGLLADC